MIEQDKLMEMLLSIKEVARVQQNVITKEEIKNYFNGEDIDDSQFAAIYQYLGENGIAIPGFIHVEYGKPEEDEEELEETKTASVEEEDEDELSEKPDILSLYMEELGELKKVETSELASFFMLARKGDAQAKNKLIESYLPIAVEIANEYKDKGVLIEDLIQEGNIGLLQGIASLDTLENMDDAEEFLRENIKMAICAIIDDSGEIDLESSMISKTSLLNEAIKFMTNDLGHTPTLEELSTYTQVPIDEVKELLALSKDAVKHQVKEQKDEQA